MAYTLEALEGDIRNYTEVDSTVFTGALLTRFIEMQNLESILIALWIQIDL